MLLNLQAFESYKRAGVDLLGAHRDDFPPEDLRWVEEGQRLSALDFYRDQEIRTEIHNAFQGVLNAYDLLVTPTLACRWTMPMTAKPWGRARSTARRWTR